MTTAGPTNLITLLVQHFWKQQAVKIAPPGEPFKLASGKLSDYYLDCRRVVLSGGSGRLVADLLADEITNRALMLDEAKPIFIGGIGVGGGPLVGTLMFHYTGFDTYIDEAKGFMVREATKEHGLKRKIEGHLPTATAAGHVFFVEDVITTGKSIHEAAKVVEEAGHKIDGIFGIVDREQGGVEHLRAAGYHVECLLTAKEILAHAMTWRDL